MVLKKIQVLGPYLKKNLCTYIAPIEFKLENVASKIFVFKKVFDSLVFSLLFMKSLG